MQEQLFPADAEQPMALVEAADFDPALRALAGSLPAGLRMGTSSWHYPGWAGLVWKRDYPREALSRHGLAAYARHPLLRTVGVDRTFYRPLSAVQFAAMAEQVPEDFRFVVKAPNRITDALLRDEAGRGLRPNPGFLSPECALRDFVEPALVGLGRKLGALVFQISPLPARLLTQTEPLIDRLHAMLATIPDLRTGAPDGVLAVEVRDPQWLTPRFTQALKEGGATYCMGLHAKMPSITDQLPILRALWPGPLVCRWNFNPRHGASGYEEARRLYLPYDQLVDEDLDTRNALARVIAGTVAAGQNAFITLSNKSEGCAPLSVAALARAVVALRG